MVAASPGAPLIVSVESNVWINEFLVDVLGLEGFRTVPWAMREGEAPEQLIAFLDQLQPDVCMYAISLPDNEQWQAFQRVRGAIPDCRFVLTTTDSEALEALTGPEVTVAMISKPFDVDELFVTVRRQIEPTSLLV